ncbi:hypothetical protein E2C01_035177 [Portunus trituberculatus]|uniref:Uncharacterized protein n=1 Tax=Portunus trituberculatus TaxID=210409 RepID=A0A5B7F7S3_PORTR|nr:hypothetical protein [Portunus trituberculatus]
MSHLAALTTLSLTHGSQTPSAALHITLRRKHVQWNLKIHPYCFSVEGNNLENDGLVFRACTKGRVRDR